MMDKVASEIRKLESFTGDARLFQLSEPVVYDMDYDTEQYQKSTNYVVVSATVAAYSGPETYIFPASPEGEVVSWIELDGSYRGGLDHQTALENAGYKVVRQ